MNLLTDKEISFLDDLIKNEIEFIVLGLSAAALQGAPVVTQDIDLWFKDLSDPRINQTLNQHGGVYIPPFNLNPPMFAGNGMSLFDLVLMPSGLSEFDEEYKNTIHIEVGGVQLPVLKLERIIHSKKTADRQKDRLVVPLLEEVLLTRKKMKK